MIVKTDCETDRSFYSTHQEHPRRHPHRGPRHHPHAGLRRGRGGALPTEDHLRGSDE